jgi:regulator of nonsense transcripts 2
MDVEFMLIDSVEAVRPKLEMPKTVEAAAIAVDEMFNIALQAAGMSLFSGCVIVGVILSF